MAVPALQLLNGEIPRARLSDVVEPFFLGAGKDLPPGKAFAEMAAKWKAKGVQFHASVDSGSLFSGATSGTKIALIAGRTCDNPGFFRQAIKAGATHMLLEKPGARLVGELEAMAREAKAAKVPVYMGFIKNISGYVEGALAAANGAAGAGAVETKLVSRNDYTEATLQECFERNAEGMLKNMAIHEIALACQFWGMRADNASDGSATPRAARILPAATCGRSAARRTSPPSTSRSSTVRARRCASRRTVLGLAAAARPSRTRRTVWSCTSRRWSARGQEGRRGRRAPRLVLAPAHTQAESTPAQGVCAAHALAGTTPPGVATIEIACEALKLAEWLTPELQKKLKK